MTSKLIILCGLPGSGKSTFVQKFLTEQCEKEYFIYSTDDYIEKKAKEMNLTYNDLFHSAYKEAVQFMDQEVSKAIQSGVDVLWDQTNLSLKKRKSILLKFDSSRYIREYVCFSVPIDQQEWHTLFSRLSSRIGKTISAHIVESMSLTYSKPTLEEGFSKIIFYNLYGEEYE